VENNLFNENYFKKGLNDLYSSIVNLDKNKSEEEVRLTAANKFYELFSNANLIIKGSEYLPYKSSSIFIYNHLNNNPDYLIGSDFQITLDSHFISSFILNKYYRKPGIRIVRCSLENEKNHKSYYDRFGYIRVFSKNFIPKNFDKDKLRKFNSNFFQNALNELENDNGIIISPEGISQETESSPGPFKSGAFKLATMAKKEPFIVPIVMVNFDKVISKNVLKCEILKPFKMSDFGICDANDSKMEEFLIQLNQKFKKKINSLREFDLDFQQEVRALKNKIISKKNKNDLLVLYGSSTLRLWKSFDKDFKNHNTLNLGFGGSSIDSMIDNFHNLFKTISPKTIVLYCGGNDLALGFSPKEIFNKLVELIKMINQKYKSIKIINIQLKPSIERVSKLTDIIFLNSIITEYFKKYDNLMQLNCFEEIVQNGIIDKSFFLRDGLHLNRKGYELIINKLNKILSNDN
jgi:lysophospholipase L1-like esterase/1-acyl-sn-glycerol-3-phosphate acyltransferase